MPTILILFGIRFFFYSREHEPAHVHIETGDGRAKFEVDPEVRLVENKGVKKQGYKTRRKHYRREPRIYY